MRTYTLTAALVVLGYFLVAPAVNYSVDPFGYWGTNSQAYYFGSEREIKRGLIEKRRYDGLVMGSSKVAAMKTGQIPGYHVLNAAWSAGLPEEFLYFLEETDPQIRFLAIGLDLYMFNEQGFPLKTPADFNSSRHAIDYLISPSLLWKSLQTVRMHLQDRRPWIRPDGARNYAEGFDSERAVDDEGALQKVQSIYFTNFRFSQRRIENLREISDHCDRTGIQLIIWLNPCSQPVLDLIAGQHVRQEWSRLKQELSDFPNFIDLSESYSDRSFFARHDPVHYYPSVALDIFEEHIRPQIERPASVR